MQRALDKRTFALLAATLAALAIFALDVFTPPQLAVWTLYVVPLFTLIWWGRKRDVYIIAVLCVALIGLGYYLAPAEQRMTYALTNRLLEIAIILAFAVGMGRRIDARRELMRQHSRLKRMLDERSRALEALMTQQHSEAESAARTQLSAAERDAPSLPLPAQNEEQGAAARPP